MRVLFLCVSGTFNVPISVCMLLVNADVSIYARAICLSLWYRGSGAHGMPLSPLHAKMVQVLVRAILHSVSITLLSYQHLLILALCGGMSHFKCTRMHLLFRHRRDWLCLQCFRGQLQQNCGLRKEPSFRYWAASVQNFTFKIKSYASWKVNRNKHLWCGNWRKRNHHYHLPEVMQNPEHWKPAQLFGMAFETGGCTHSMLIISEAKVWNLCHIRLSPGAHAIWLCSV